MGNKYSCISSRDDRRHTSDIGPPLPVSHITLKSHRSYPSLSKSFSSNESLYEKARSRTDGDPCSYSFPPPLSLPVISTLPPPSLLRPSLPAYIPQAQLRSLGEQAVLAYSDFLHAYPEYHNTWIIDTLRRSDFARLDRVGETYVDYMGGAQHPECLVRAHGDFLTQSIMGNTHSVSNSSRLSSECAEEARKMVLSFFQAPTGYTVIFTANATGALKLVGEAFPFREDSAFVLGADSHNSVHGIREFAARRRAKVHYIPSTPTGGFEPSVAKNILRSNRPVSTSTLSLFALTGQSNISNSKNSLSILRHASSLGYYTLLDAAALAPTSVISLTETPVDAMAVSFYKMFGYPTGVGALIVKESFLAMLERPWFAGGTVNVVQVPGTLVTRAHKLHEQFEDGTVNYLTLSAVTDGLRFLSAYLPFLPLRLSCLMHSLTSSMAELRHDTNGMPVIKILSRLPSRRLRSIGEQSDTGSTVSFVILSPTGDMIPNSFIEHVATMHNISLRTGCMCNPGGASALLGIQQVMESLCDGATLRDVETRVGQELGVVRVSLGLGSDWGDVWRVMQLFQGFGDERRRTAWWDAWAQVPIGQAV
ncbi:pyridoxal phosphate-dependent transferase [Boletus edulis]|nr:pyridoxal phosphate-dependent transferase [Boletus edulis]